MDSQSLKALRTHIVCVSGGSETGQDEQLVFFFFVEESHSVALYLSAV